jgi:uncharacterized phage-like protein YoqJ
MKLCGTGHRPDKIGGYDPMAPLRRRIHAEIELRLAKHDPEVVISGMALGFDQDLALASIALGIPFIAAVPFAGQDARWPAASRQIYAHLLTKAERVVYVSPPGYSAEKMQIRNQWMLNQVGSDGVVLACWDGSSGGTCNCLAVAERLGRKIDRIDPRLLR